MAHRPGASRLARQMHVWNLSVMVFTGFTLEELKRRGDPDIDDFVGHTDILVDGPYRQELPRDSARWIGSDNQPSFF